MQFGEISPVYLEKNFPQVLGFKLLCAPKSNLPYVKTEHVDCRKNVRCTDQTFIITCIYTNNKDSCTDVQSDQQISHDIA